MIICHLAGLILLESDFLAGILFPRKSLSDTNPWFGNPENFAPSSYQPKGTITWGEFYLEPGLAGITGLGNSPVYIYGGASYTVSGTVQLILAMNYC